MDKFSLFSCALSHIGAGSYNAKAASAELCDRWYPLVMREAAVRHNWSFSRRLATISPSSDGTYTLPDDCMNILYLRDSSDAKPDSLLVVDRTVHTSATGPLTLVYTSSTVADLQELPDSSPEFCTAVTYLLAARICRSLTGDFSMVDFCEQKAEQQFQKAIVRDAQQEHSNKTNKPFARQVSGSRASC